MTYLEALQASVLVWMRQSDKDFQTPEWMYEQMRVADSPDTLLADIRWALSALERKGKIRRPIVTDPQYNDWWRLTELGTTRKEKLRRFLAYASHDFGSLREDMR